MPVKEFDVTVVGAGLSGLHCARLLGERGLQVLLVDRKSALDQKVHTTGIFVRKTLEDFEFPPQCLGPVIRDVNLYSPGRKVFHLHSKRDEFQIGKMGPLYLEYLNGCQRAGVKWRANTSYLDHSREGAFLDVRLATAAGLETISTRFLIGADGVCSRVARDLGLDKNREWIVGVENVYANLHIEGGPRLFCFLEPELAPGYIAWIAWDGEEAHIGVGGYPARFDPASALEKFQLSVSHLVDLKGATLLERRGGRIPVGGVLRRIANRNGLLVGDAAGAVSPLTAGGLDPCLRLSTLAAQVTFKFLASGDRHDLAAYSGEQFRARFTSRIWARRLISLMRHRGLLELGCGLLRAPFLKRIAGHVFFGRASFPDVTTDANAFSTFDKPFQGIEGSAARPIVRPTQV